MKTPSLGWCFCLILFLATAQAAAEALPQYGYSGREADASGLIYYRARYYDPAGYFTQRDPIGLGGGINDYAYVGGEPIGHIDPQGTLVTETLRYIGDHTMGADLSPALPDGFADWTADQQHQFEFNALHLSKDAAMVALAVQMPLLAPLVWKNATAATGGFLYGATNTYLAGGPRLQILTNGVASAITAMILANAGPAVCGNGPSLCLAAIRSSWGIHNLVMQEANSVGYGDGHLKNFGDLNAYAAFSTALGGHLLMYAPWLKGLTSMNPEFLGMAASKTYMLITTPYLIEVDANIKANFPTQNWTFNYLAQQLGGVLLNTIPYLSPSAATAAARGPSIP